jgi:hypothetical protein
MDADRPPQDQFAAMEARLQVLEDRIGQVETQVVNR